ncbi:PREDICTED: mitochondrial inner membrane protease subunit 1-like isoform 2 [Fragaria vesca subsp. vesca]
MALRYLTNFIASEAFKTAGRELRDGVPRLVKFVCCLKLTNTYLFTVVLTYGPSMLPTFGLAGNLSLAERVSTRFEKLGVGDIVLLRSPEVPKKIVTKRLVAMEGQSVSYIVDPKNSDRVETVVGMFGCREIISMIRMIRGSLGLFLMVFYKAESFGGFGHLKILDHWRKAKGRLLSHED